MDEDSLLLSEHGGLRGHGVPGVQLDDYGNDGLSEGQPHYLSLAQAEATFNQVILSFQINQYFFLTVSLVIY